ncbi:MAG: thiolase family protein [Bacteroidetes bacterium]|nr:thiolase family protein [Bacteroidota bacterium]
MSEVFVLSAKRSPIGRFGGSYSSLGPAQLATPILRGVLDQAGNPDELLDLLIMGNVLSGGHGQLIARQAAKHAQIPDSVDAVMVDMVCSSGMMSVIMGASLIQSRMTHLVLAAGVESMSTAGFGLSSKARWGYKYLPVANEPLVDLLHQDGLKDPISGESMGVQAERTAQLHQISRRELDELAALSHARADSANKSDRFTQEITTIHENNYDLLRSDEGIRPDTTVEGLSTLPSVFTSDGVLTSGNSSQISDGAAALLLASEGFVKTHGVNPVARILGYGWSAGEWSRFIEAPIKACSKVLKNLNMEATDIDLYENNEAFALSTSLFLRGMEIDTETLNVHGGAIALGHPLGCSGTRIIVTLIHALTEYQKSLGLATLCHGTGGATAIALERL